MKKLFLSVIFLTCFTSSVFSSESMISVKSHYTVKETADRFEKILKKKGLVVFSRINHQKNASNVNLELAATELIIFGNPKVGTPLMQCAKTVAIDLPQKVLAWKDEKGQVWLTYNNPEYLKERHNIKGCDLLLNKISDVLDKLVKVAISK